MNASPDTSWIPNYVLILNAVHPLDPISQSSFRFAKLVFTRLRHLKWGSSLLHVAQPDLFLPTVEGPGSGYQGDKSHLKSNDSRRAVIDGFQNGSELLWT